VKPSLRLVAVSFVLAAGLSGCLRGLPDPVYKQDEWTVHLITGCSEGGGVVDTLHFQNLSFRIDRMGECLYIQAGRLVKPLAPAEYRLQLDSPTTDYYSLHCGDSRTESYAAHVNWTFSLDAGKSKCDIWSQPNREFSGHGPFTMDVDWTNLT
jgi:hypothetical protein